MSSFNQATLIGNLGNDPDVIKQSQNGAFVRLSIATNSRKALANGDFVDDVQWHTVFVNGATGKYVAEYLKKGDKVFVVGEIRTNSYQKHGQTLYSTAIYTNVCKWLASKKPVEEESFPMGDATSETTPVTAAHEATQAPKSNDADEEASSAANDTMVEPTTAPEALLSHESDAALVAENREEDHIPF